MAIWVVSQLYISISSTEPSGENKAVAFFFSFSTVGGSHALWATNHFPPRFFWQTGTKISTPHPNESSKLEIDVFYQPLFSSILTDLWCSSAMPDSQLTITWFNSWDTYLELVERDSMSLLLSWPWHPFPLGQFALLWHLCLIIALKCL